MGIWIGDFKSKTSGNGSSPPSLVSHPANLLKFCPPPRAGKKNAGDETVRRPPLCCEK
jgi:hypothetical protein